MADSLRTLNLDPSVPHGQDLISLQTSWPSCSSTMDSTHVKQLAHTMALLPPESSFGDGQGIISCHSVPPSSQNEINFELISDSLRTRDTTNSGPTPNLLCFHKDNRVTAVLNRPNSVPEADATHSPDCQNEKSLNNLLNISYHNSDDKNNLKSMKENSEYSHNEDYNNLDKSLGYYPKEGGPLRKHINLAMSSDVSCLSPAGINPSRHQAQSASLHPNKQDCTVISGNLLPSSSWSNISHQKIFNHRNQEGNGNHVSNADSNKSSSSLPTMIIKKREKETVIYDIHNLDSCVQIGDNNIMYIVNGGPVTLSSHSKPLSASSSSSSFSCSSSNDRQSPPDAKKSKGIKKIMVLNKIVDREEMNIVSDAISMDWTRLARQLHVRDSDISRYQVDFQYYGVQEMAYQMLCGWREKVGPKATMAALANALLAIKRPDIALSLSCETVNTQN